MKPFKVVCVKQIHIFNDQPSDEDHVIKGEIYTVIQVDAWEVSDKLFYTLKEKLYENNYCASLFRPVDDTFGEWVEETLMKELEYQEALKH